VAESRSADCIGRRCSPTWASPNWHKSPQGWPLRRGLSTRAILVSKKAVCTRAENMCNAFRDRHSRLRPEGTLCPKGSPASFPSALAQQHVKELSRLFGREEVLVVVNFRAGNWHRIHFTKCVALGMTTTLATGACTKSCFSLSRSAVRDQKSSSDASTRVGT